MLLMWKWLKARNWKDFIRSLALVKCAVAQELASKHSVYFNPSDHEDQKVLMKCEDINSHNNIK